MALAEAVANHVLDRLGISLPEDLLLLDEIVYARGALLRECTIEGAEARLLLGPGRPIISVSSSPVLHLRRRRFSVAHELGHFEIQRGATLLRSCSSLDIRDNPDIASADPEQEANQFASAFLLPGRFVQQPFSQNQPAFDLVSEWADKLQTSLTATAFRFLRFTREPVAAVYSVGGKIQYFQASSQFAELGVFPNVNGPPGMHTGATELFSGKHIQSGWREVRASAWFRDDTSAYDRDDTIAEWSIGMPNYDAVLSLLWVNQPLGLNGG